MKPIQLEILAAGLLLAPKQVGYEALTLAPARILQLADADKPKSRT